MVNNKNSSAEQFLINRAVKKYKISRPAAYVLLAAFYTEESTRVSPSFRTFFYETKNLFQLVKKALFIYPDFRRFSQNIVLWQKC